MMKKAVSSVLAVVMVFCSLIFVPFAVHAEETPDRDIESVADSDTSDGFANYFAEYEGQNVFWSDKSVTDNGDGTMNVVISAMVQKVAQEEGVTETEPVDETEGEDDSEPEQEPESIDLGSVLDEDGVTVFSDELGDGFFIDSSIFVRTAKGDYEFVFDDGSYHEANGESGVTIDKNGSELVISVDNVLVPEYPDNSNPLRISYKAKLGAEESGTYYVSNGCSVRTSGRLADVYSEIAKPNDPTESGQTCRIANCSGGKQEDVLYNTGRVVLSIPVFFAVGYTYDDEYPEAIMVTLPVDEGQYSTGADVTPTMPSVTSVDGEKDGQAGVWTFAGWDAESKTIEDADVTFVGHWDFEASILSYGVSYSYGDAYPENVMATLPTDAEVYPSGTSIDAAAPSSTSVEGELNGQTGVWSFAGWDAASKTVEDNDVTFVGHWDFEASVAYYGVSYSYDDAYPEAVMATLPSDDEQYASGSTVDAISPSETAISGEVDGHAGTWTFTGWDEASKLIENDGVTFVGHWDFTADTVYYGVSYVYDAEYPADVMATLPTDSEQYEDGTEVQAQGPSTTAVSGMNGDAKGVWNFNGWDATTKIINGESIEFVGSWSFVADEPDVEYFTESYKYDKDYPSIVMNTIPTRAGSYANGTDVTAASPSANEVNGDNGVWKFNGWDSDVKTVLGQNVEFVGSWTFTEAQVDPEPPVVVQYTEHYQYDKTYPDYIMTTLPTRADKYDDGADVTPAAPKYDSVVGDKDGKNGTWTFTGWDAPSKRISGADVTFVGSWSFKEAEAPIVKTYAEKYKYDKAYPADVMATLPVSTKTHEDGATVTAMSPSVVSMSGVVDGKTGVWTFDGWDFNQKVVKGADVVFTGSWTFKADPEDVVGADVTVIWIDSNNTEKTRPSEVTVHLLANGAELDRVKLSESNGWVYHFTNLPRKNSKGREIVYEVKQDAVANYTTTITTQAMSETHKNKDGSTGTSGVYKFTITNQLNAGVSMPETGSLSSILFMLIGAGVVLLGGLWFFFSKRKETE